MESPIQIKLISGPGQTSQARLVGPGRPPLQGQQTMLASQADRQATSQPDIHLRRLRPTSTSALGGVSHAQRAIVQRLYARVAASRRGGGALSQCGPVVGDSRRRARLRQRDGHELDGRRANGRRVGNKWALSRWPRLHATTRLRLGSIHSIELAS